MDEIINILPVIISSVVTLVISIPTFYAIGYSRKSNEAETLSTYQEMSLEAYKEMTIMNGEIKELQKGLNENQKLIREQEAKIAKLNKTLCEYRHILVEWQDGIRKLITQLENNHLTPDWKPESTIDEVD